MMALVSTGISAGICAMPASAAHPFYERRLTEGLLAYEQGRLEEAARSFEIAAFGLLEEPPRLTETLVRLALAQANLERAPAFRNMVRRVAELEDRFGSYRAAGLSDTERVDFSARIRELIPESVLARTPAYRQLMEDEEEARPKEPVAAEQGEVAEPVDPGKPTESEVLQPVEQAQVTRARQILTEAQQAGALDEARTLAQPVADAHPGRSDLQQLVGEIAYRSSRWREAADYLSRGLGRDLASGTGPRVERPELLFYLAVSLYESGRPAEARAPLERALPRIERTRFVDQYVERILSRAEKDDMR